MVGRSDRDAQVTVSQQVTAGNAPKRAKGLRPPDGRLLDPGDERNTGDDRPPGAHDDPTVRDQSAQTTKNPAGPQASPGQVTVRKRLDAMKG